MKVRSSGQCGMCMTTARTQRAKARMACTTSPPARQTANTRQYWAGRTGHASNWARSDDAYRACVDHNWSLQTPEVQATRHGTVNRTPQPKPTP